MFEVIISLLVLVAVGLLVAIFFPKSILVRGKDEDSDRSGFIYQIKPLLTEMAKYNAKIQLIDYKHSLKRQMIAAGDPLGIKLQPDEFIALAELAALGASLVFGLVFGFSPSTIVIGAIFGFGMPHLWLNDSVKRRKTSIRRQLPDFLDLLTLSV